MRKKELMEEKQVKKFPMKLQFFAESGGAGDDGADGSDVAGDDGDDQDDDEADENGDEEAKFTQADINKAIKKRLERERRKWERKQSSEKKDDNESDKNESKDDDAVKQAEVRAQKAEMKILCYEHDISKDCVDDVIALAHSYLDDDTDMEDAIEKVVKKYPHFTKSSESEEDKEPKKAWGQRQTRKAKEKTSGVEAAFLKKNPGLKID